MKNVLAILAATVIAAPFAATAQDINYNYIDGLYVNTDVDGFDDNADGFGARASFGLGRNLHLVGSWFNRELEVGGSDFDIDRTTFGIGFHWAVADSADWLVDVEYLNEDFDDISDQDGYQVSTGFRAYAGENFEVDGGIRYADLDDDSETFGYLRGIYFLDENWGLTGEIEAGEDDHSFLLGARLSF